MPELHPLIWALIIGFLAGFLANLLVGGGGGILINILVGILGAVVASWLLPKLGITMHLVEPELLNTILVSTIGAVVVLLLARLISRR